ncbi:11370_t:CDS:10 [Diversispora eburnea]|uniref:11370_t:CDS:1 n=1 Tax=Diversispora eburnea TaxID=1213867 RepID=A0A9N8V1G0_9GLOM|nr:11370_t:CDS:10 [Diversispora eburnea]
MSNIEETDKTPLRDLLRRVARAFFQTQHIVVLDQLAFHEQISDENLAKCVGLTVKEIHKLCGNLKEARLIKTYTKSEPKKAEARAIPRTYYNIDWQQTFAPLEVRNLLDDAKQAFLCDVCSTELIHNDNAENVKGTELLHGRFMEQTSTGAKGGQPGSTREQDLQYSQDTGANSGDIVVVFQDDNESSKIDKQNEMAKKRTVSGDATVTNTGILDAAQENEHQNSEIVRVNEKDEQRNDTDGSPMIDLEEEEFEEVEFGVVEEVEFGVVEEVEFGVVEDEFMDEFEEDRTLLHAFSGNFVELVIESFALVDKEYAIVRSAILVVFLAGSWPTHRRRASKFHIKDSSFEAKLFVDTSSSILALAVLALVIPAAFKIANTQSGEDISPNDLECDVQNISRATSIILLLVFFGLLVFQLKTHSDQVVDAKEFELFQYRYHWLIDFLFGIIFCARYLVTSVEELAEEYQLGSGFIGVVIFPLCVCSNFIEHFTAIRCAYHDRVDTAMGLIMNTSVVITPILTIAGWIMERPLTLDFNVLEISVLACAVLIVNFLVAVSYFLIAIAFFYLPSPPEEDKDLYHCNPFSHNREEIARDISCYGLPYGTWGIASGPVIYTCVRCNKEWVFVLMACGKLAPWALKMLNDRITLKFKNEKTLRTIKGLVKFGAKDKSKYDDKNGDDSDDEDTKNKSVTRALNKILSICVVLAIIVLCIGGWAALMKFILMVAPPKYSDTLNVSLAWIMSVMIIYFLVASHVFFSHIILAELYKNWNGLSSETFPKISAIY